MVGFGLLATWFFAWLVLYGVGVLAARLLRLPASLARGDLFFVGWGTVAGATQLVHLVVPIGTPVLAAVVVTGLAGFIIAIAAPPGDRSAPFPTGPVLATIAFALLVARRALGAPELYDTGLYHLQAVAWMREHALVPGLANLHGRLGFGSASFGIVALLESTPWAGEAYRVAAGLVLVPAFALVATAADRARRAGDHAGMIFRALLLPVLVAVGLGPGNPSASPDTVVFGLSVLLAHVLFDVDATEPDGEGAARLRHLVFLAALGVAVKLSMVAAAAGSVIAALVLRGRLREPGAMSARGVARLLAGSWPALFLLVPFLVRNVVLSGYPIYPASTVGSIPVSWSVPEPCVSNAAAWIRSWARAPGLRPEDVTGGTWIAPWLARLARDYQAVLAPVVLTLISGAVVLGKRLVGVGPWRRSVLAVAAVALATLAHWFWTAPDPRFLGGALWVLAAGATTLAVGTNRRLAIAGAISAVVLAAVFARRDIVAFRGGWQLVPTPRVDTDVRATATGLQVRVPRAGAQCWGAPIPCTPYFDSNLALRVPAKATSGFVGGSVGREADCHL